MTKNSDFKAKIIETVLQRVVEKDYLVGWLDSIGELGRPPKKGQKNPIAPATRVQAAKTGIEFTAKFFDTAGASAGGTDLLKELAKLESRADGADAEPAESGDWAEDADAGREDPDME